MGEKIVLTLLGFAIGVPVGALVDPAIVVPVQLVTLASIIIAEIVARIASKRED